MNDLELLKTLQKELINTLEERSKFQSDYYFIPRKICKAKIKRLRLQIQEVMLRIENQCE